MRLIDADALKRKAQRAATESWKMRVTARIETVLNQFIDWIDNAPSIQPEQRWIPVTETPPRGRDLMLKIHDACNSFFYYHMGFHDGEKYFTYNFFWQRDKDLEIVGWQLCPWEEGEQE